MKKAALINIYYGFRSKKKERAIPLALMYLSSALKKKNIDTIVLDIDTEEPDAITKGVERILQEDLLFMGISATFGVFTLQMIQFAELFRKSRPEVPIIWGGWHTSIYSDYFIKEPVVDIVVKWEGEATLSQLVDHFRDNVPLRKIKGIIFKENGETVETPNRPWIDDLNALDLDFNCIDDFSPYIIEFPNGKKLFQSYQSSRGCPYNCDFCYNNRSSMVGGRVKCRVKSVDKVLKEIDTIRRFTNFEYIQFVDDYFFVHKKRGLEILEKLYQRGISIYNMELRAHDFTPDILEVMEKTRVFIVYFGLESENQRILKLINKGITREQIDSALELSGKYGLTVNAQMILGIPSHTKDEIKNSVKFGLDMMQKYEHFSVGFVPYNPLRGTVLGEIARKESNYSEPSDIIRLSQMHSGSFFKGYNRELPWLKWASQKDILFLQQTMVIMQQAYLKICRDKTFDIIRESLYQKLINMQPDIEEEKLLIEKAQKVRLQLGVNKDKIDGYLHATVEFIATLIQRCSIDDELKMWLYGCEFIMIFGAGTIAQLIYNFLNEMELQVDCFILSKPEPGQEFMEKPCINLTALRKKFELSMKEKKGTIINTVVYSQKEINVLLNYLVGSKPIKILTVNDLFQTSFDEPLIDKQEE